MANRALDHEYIERLHELYDAEEAMVRELPAAISEMSSPEMRLAFEYCLEQSQEYLHHTELLLDRAHKCTGLGTLSITRRMVFRYSRRSGVSKRLR